MLYLPILILTDAHERTTQSVTHLASLVLHALPDPEGCRSLSWSWTSSRTRLVTAFQRETARCPSRRMESGSLRCCGSWLAGKDTSRCSTAAFAPAGCGTLNPTTARSEGMHATCRDGDEAQAVVCNVEIWSRGSGSRSERCQTPAHCALPRNLCCSLWCFKQHSREGLSGQLHTPSGNVSFWATHRASCNMSTGASCCGVHYSFGTWPAHDGHRACTT